MRYDELRDQVQEALREVGLLIPRGHGVVETVELDSTTRRCELYLSRSAPARAEPLHVSAKVAFDWSPFNAARSYTCEEDLLSEVLGRRAGRRAKTAPRFVRVDLVLRASLRYGSATPMPDPQLLGPWTASASAALDTLDDIRERAGRVVAVLGSHEHVRLEARCEADGVVVLEGLSMSGFRMVRVPRAWDDPERRDAEKGMGAGLERMARQFKDAWDAWTESVAELATWIRYSPPPPETKPMGPWFDLEDEDGGPDTIH